MSNLSLTNYRSGISTPRTQRHATTIQPTRTTSTNTTHHSPTGLLPREVDWLKSCHAKNGNLGLGPVSSRTWSASAMPNPCQRTGREGGTRPSRHCLRPRLSFMRLQAIALNSMSLY